MQFVDEQDQLGVLRGHLVYQLLRALLEFAAILCARNHGVDVHLDEALVAQHLWHVAIDDALREAFDNRSFPNPRLADQHRIILLAPGKDFDRTLDFLRATEHRVELALPRHCRKVAAELVERRGARRRIDSAVLRALADDFHHLLAQRLGRHAVLLQQSPRDAVRDSGKADEQMLRANVRMSQVTRRLKRVKKGFLQARRNRHSINRCIRLGSARLRMLVDVPPDVLRRELQLLEQRGPDVSIGKHVQQMLCIKLIATQFVGFLCRALQEFKSLLAERIGDIHGFTRHLCSQPRILGLMIHHVPQTIEETRQATTQ